MDFYMFTVYHASSFNAFDPGEFPKGFVKAAEVETPVIEGVDTEGYLEAVFELTNSINEHWSNNINVRMFDSRRSTSVGDVIQSGERRFIVDPLGFTELS